MERVTQAMGDHELLDRHSRGDRGALDVLFERYRDAAYRVAYRLLGNDADALDAVQNGFIKVLNHLDSFESRASFKTWLLRIVSNASLDAGRSRKRRTTLTETAGQLAGARAERTPDHADPALQAEESDLRGAVVRALESLPEAQRQTFTLHVDAGLSYREIAEVMRTSIGTVMSRLFYARQKLQGLLASQVAL
jgi:RNA polymerase sigma-70 factor, ECF subfamily